MNKYRCIKSSKAFRLTKGQVYSEWNNHPCSFNSAVENDNGRVVFVPRKTYFVVEELK